MATSESEIKKQISAHIKKCGGAATDWYVGISKEPKNRLLNGHNAEKAARISKKAESAIIARKIEKYFIEKIRTDGGDGGGDDDAVYVYAYKKTPETCP